jgi:hypothetical protein
MRRPFVLSTDLGLTGTHGCRLSERLHHFNRDLVAAE